MGFVIIARWIKKNESLIVVFLVCCLFTLVGKNIKREQLSLDGVRMKFQQYNYSAASFIFVALVGFSFLSSTSVFSNSRSLVSQELRLPIKARVEVILPVSRGIRSGDANFIFPVLKKVFTDVKLRGRIKHPHFSVFLRIEAERRRQFAYVNIHLKLNTGRDVNITRLLVEARVDINDFGVKGAYSRAFSRAYAQILKRLISNREFARVVRRGINNSIARKNDMNGMPVVSSRYKHLNDSVATIRVLTNKGRQLGSGFFVSNNGLMLTNYHVIDKARRIAVKLTNKKVYPAVVVAKDAWMDIALIKVKIRNNKFIPLDLKFSKYKIGDEVIAIGSPLSTAETISKGILSSVKNVSGYRILQTDAAINRGNSGGPLIHLSTRKLIGINTFKRANGIAYAMSLHTIRSFIRENRKIVKISNKGKLIVTIPMSFKVKKPIASRSLFSSFDKSKETQGRHYTRRGKKFGITVYSDPAEAISDTRTARQMTNQITRIIERRLFRLSLGSVIGVKVGGNSARKYIYEGRSSKYSKRLCRKYRLDGVVTFSFEHSEGGQGSLREVEVAFFDCRANRKTQKVYSISLSNNDVNPYDTRIKAVVTTLLRQVRK